MVRHQNCSYNKRALEAIATPRSSHTANSHNNDRECNNNPDEVGQTKAQLCLKRFLPNQPGETLEGIELSAVNKHGLVPAGVIVRMDQRRHEWVLARSSIRPRELR